MIAGPLDTTDLASQPPRDDRWWGHRATVVRLARYTAVSGVSTTTSLITLGILVGALGLSAAWSNVVATAVGTVPSFELNRRWVWSSRTRRSVVRQVVPFCALSFLGLLVSTVAVAVAAAHTATWGRWPHTMAVEAANVLAYGTLWVVQYQLLHRVLFHSPTLPDSPSELDGPVPISTSLGPTRTSSLLTADHHPVPSSVVAGLPMISSGASHPMAVDSQRR